MKKILTILFAGLSMCMMAQDLTGVRIFINPGHGGYESNDRNIAAYPFESGDHNGFWESTSNLDKGLMLDTLLRSKNCQTKMSRIHNTEADDLDLDVIVAMANAYNADFMLSIHSNAGVNNYVVVFYAGQDATDTHVYPTPALFQEESRAIATTIVNNLGENKITVWGYPTPRALADKSWCSSAFGWSDGYGVLRGLSLPGGLSEGSMHDYIPETYRLLNMNYKYIEAWHFFKSFCTYFKQQKVATSLIAGCLRDSENKIEFPDFYKIKNSQDEKLPLDTSWVYLIQGGVKIDSCRTDTLYNGVYLFKDVQPGTYTVRATGWGYYDQDQVIDVVEDEVHYLNFAMEMHRNTPPVVVSYSPNVNLTDSVECSVDVLMRFNWDMKEDSTMAAFSISPAVEGTLSMESSNKVLRFHPNSGLDKATTYTVTLSTTACHPDTHYPNHLTQPFSFQFVTKNRSRLNVVNSFPSAYADDVPVNPSFILIFDQPLKSTTNAKANLFVEDGVGNVQAMNSRTLTIKGSVPQPYGFASFNLVNALLPNTTYKLVISSDLADVNGIYHNERTEIPFTTTGEQTIEGNLINNMDAVSFVYQADKSRDVVSGSVLRNTTKKLFDQASNELMYSFNGTQEGEAFYASLNPMAVVVTSTDKMGMYVMGDYSFNEVEAEFNCEGDIKYTPLAVLDYSGWKYCEADLTKLPAGLNYQFTGLKILYKEGMLANAGSIFVDNQMWQKIETALPVILTQPASSVKCYDLLGRPVTNKTKQQVIILNGQKILQR